MIMIAQLGAVVASVIAPANTTAPKTAHLTTPTTVVAVAPAPTTTTAPPAPTQTFAPVVQAPNGQYTTTSNDGGYPMGYAGNQATAEAVSTNTAPLCTVNFTTVVNGITYPGSYGGSCATAAQMAAASSTPATVVQH